MKTILLSEASNDVKFVDGKLFFGEREVLFCDHADKDKVAAMYQIRVWDDKEHTQSSFSSTLDLSGDKFWLCAARINMWKNQNQEGLPSLYVSEWKDAEYLLNNLYADTAGHDWFICEENDFEQAYLESLEEDYERSLS